MKVYILLLLITLAAFTISHKKKKNAKLTDQNNLYITNWKEYQLPVGSPVTVQELKKVMEKLSQFKRLEFCPDPKLSPDECSRLNVGGVLGSLVKRYVQSVGGNVNHDEEMAQKLKDNEKPKIVHTPKNNTSNKVDSGTTNGTDSSGPNGNITNTDNSGATGSTNNTDSSGITGITNGTDSSGLTGNANNTDSNGITGNTNGTDSSGSTGNANNTDSNGITGNTNGTDSSASTGSGSDTEGSGSTSSANVTDQGVTNNSSDDGVAKMLRSRLRIYGNEMIPRLRNYYRKEYYAHYE